MKIDTKEDTYRRHIIDSSNRYAQNTSLGCGACDGMSDTRTANHTTQKSHVCALPRSLTKPIISS